MSSPPPFPPLPEDPWSSQGERPVQSAFDNSSPQPSQPPQPPLPPQPPQPFPPPGSPPPGTPTYGSPTYGSPPQPAPFSQAGPAAPFGQQPVQSAPYGYQPYGYAATARLQTNAMAVASMVLGIIGIVLFCFYAIPSILAVIFAAISLGQFKNQPNTFTGRGMAIAGLVTGLVGVCLLVLLVSAGNFHFWFR